MPKQKYYVVWSGLAPGIYHTWAECEQQVKGVAGARYKSFATEAQARQAYEGGAPTPAQAQQKPLSIVSTSKKSSTQAASTPLKRAGAEAEALINPPDYRHDTVLPLPLAVTADAWAVDAACSGNPGPMEYRGVDLATGTTVFHYGPVHGTNNIGEFLAIVHALALMKQRGLHKTIYSDSRNAQLWVKARKCRTKLARNSHTEPLYQLINRAETWLRTHDWSDIPIVKWQTNAWGEVPADFGRK